MQKFHLFYGVVTYFFDDCPITFFIMFPIPQDIAVVWKHWEVKWMFTFLTQVRREFMIAFDEMVSETSLTQAVYNVSNMLRSGNI